MKILFLAHRTPYPPDKGDKIRSFHLLAQLAKVHDVTAVYWVDDPRDLAHTEFLGSLCRGKVLPVRLNRVGAMGRALLSLLQGKSFTAGYYTARVFHRALDTALSGGSFDAVFMFSAAMACYGSVVDAKIKIVDFVDVDSDKWRQLAEASSFPLSIIYKTEQRRLACLETQISRWTRANLFVSRADAELFKNQGGTGNIEVVPNGVELEVRRLPLQQMPFHGSAEGGADKSAEPKMIFVGTMNYRPNADAVQYFAEKIFPLVRRQFPRAIFEIVGRHPAKSIKRLERLEGIRVLGEVPDTRPYLLRAHVSVAPMRMARGVQNKVLEAMAMGVPVVASSAAVQGIEVLQDQEILIGDSPEEFAHHVIRLLGDPELRKVITKKAWMKVKQIYNWDLTGAKLDKLLKAALPCESNPTADVGISAKQA